MAFGFPASHSDQFLFRNRRDCARDVAKQAFISQGWRLTSEADDRLLATSPVNWRSWGEKICVHWVTDSAVTISSRCSWPLQCFDWGSNEDNVRSLLNAFQRAEQASAGNP
jgi:hypothetical protein